MPTVPRRALALILVLTVAASACTRDRSSAGTGSSVAWASPTVTANPIAVASPAVQLTLEEVYRRAGESLRRSGGIAHAVVERTQDAGEYSFTARSEQWVDAALDVAREEHHVTFTGEHSNGQTFSETDVILPDGRYAHHDDGTVDAAPTPSCHGATLAATVVLGCPGFIEHSTTSVEAGSYQGKPAVVLVTIGSASGSDERSTFTRRQYLDPATFLPLGSEEEGSLDYGQVVPLRAHATITRDVLAAASLPAGFFDPATLGWQGVMAPLDRAGDLGVTPYWLGARFEPGYGLPAIVPSQLELTKQYPGQPQHAYGLSYGLAGNRFGTGVVTMWVWPRGAWEAGAGPAQQASWDVHYPCHQQEELDLPGGHATITKAFQSPPQPSNGTPIACPERPFDLFAAVATFGDTVVAIQVPDVVGGQGSATNPYASLDGVRAILRGLQPRPTSGPATPSPSPASGG